MPNRLPDFSTDYATPLFCVACQGRADSHGFQMENAFNDGDNFVDDSVTLLCPPEDNRWTDLDVEER